MIYSDIDFLLLLLGTVLIYSLAIRFDSRSLKLGTLLVASFVFYAWSGIAYLLLFSSVILVTWGIIFLSTIYPNSKRWILSTGVLLLAGNLLFWKYSPWLYQAAQKRLPEIVPSDPFTLALPVGISFFTLQGIAYLVDIIKGTAKPVSLPKFSLFLAFFPQLVAGPIVRAKQLIPQLEKPPVAKREDIVHGLGLFLSGFIKKTAIADPIAGTFVNRVFGNLYSYDRIELACAVLAFAVQIWADFSGYTDMGRGAARILGFQLPENFLSPYLAKSPSEFWHRWHITLSQWIRDYIYIPLGGNRGSKLRVLAVLTITMAISGLWHGAAITFILWGLYHGALLVAEKLLKNPLSLGARFVGIPVQVQSLLAMITTFSATLFGWLLFRADGIAGLKAFFGAFAANSQTNAFVDWNCFWFSLSFCFLFQIVKYRATADKESLWDRLRTRILMDKDDSYWLNPSTRGAFLGFGMAFLFVLVLFTRGASKAAEFIYFQF